MRGFFLNCRFAVNGMKNASRLLAAGAVFGGVIGGPLEQNELGVTLSLVYVDNHAATYFSFEDFWGQRHQISPAPPR